MRLKNLIFIPAFLFFLSHGLAAQNINGLEIPIGKYQRSSISFHSEITGFLQSDKTLPYRLATIGSNMLTIEAKKEVKNPCTLTVTEGGRTHRFILVYKENIDLADQDKDFSDLEALDRLVRNLNNSNNTSPPQETNPIKSSGVINSATNDSVILLVQAAEKARNNGQLQDAKANYEQALQIKPDDDNVKRSLDEVIKAISAESTTNYGDLVTKANNAFSSGRYEEALKFYNDALVIRPGDEYATSQVGLIKQKQEVSRTEEADRRKDSLFLKYIGLGDKALSDKSYEEAEIAYREALKLKPGDALTTSKINTLKQKAHTDSLETAQKSRDALYTSFLNSGDKALQEKSYNAAIVAFMKALEIKPGDAMATSKLNSVSQQMTADSLQAEHARAQAQHDSYIKSGDDAFKNNLLDEARGNYQQALAIDPKDTYAKDQIKKIDALIEQSRIEAKKLLEAQKNAEREKQYKELIAAADNYYNSGMLPEAKNEYQKALALNSKDVYSKNKIDQIDNLIAEKKQEATRDSINTSKYTAAVLKGDENFINKNYTVAKTSYLEALKYKRDDQYAQSKLLEIQDAREQEAIREKAIKDSIAKENEIGKQYNSLMTKANAAYSKNDYAMARGLYVSAGELRPNEESPKNKIDDIDTRLKEIAFLEQQKVLADSLSNLGETALVDSDYNAALDYYTKALACNQKDLEPYLTGRISYIQKQLALKDSAIVLAKRKAEQQIKVNELQDIYHRAMDSITSRNYEAALIYFNQFIDSANNLDFVPEEYDVARFTSFAQKKVIDINESLAREKTKEVTVRTTPDKSTLPSRKVIFYPNPKDPKLNPVYKKYPDIDFNSPPKNQFFDSIADYSVENQLISREFMTVKSLSLSENTVNGITLTCQNIFFKGSKMYLKLMIQNLTQEEFLTGRMDLIEKKPDGKEIHLLPILCTV